MTPNPILGHLRLVTILSEAAGKLRQTDLTTYLWLRSFVKAGMVGDRRVFEGRFSAYYGLNRAGLTPAFKKAYFQLLFEHRPGNADPYTPILLHLHQFPRWRKDQIVAASFTSKLVAIHNEARPLFDRHVEAFFGLGVPSIGPLEHRADGFIRNLEAVRQTYETWTATPTLAIVLDQVRREHPELSACHPNRLWDFVVWAFGARVAAKAT